ncbi:MAG: AraD1 family protein [Polyangiaceae bacterium]
MRLVQLTLEDGSRAVASVDGRGLALLRGASSVRALALDAAERQLTLERLVRERLSGEIVDYDQVLEQKRLLVPLDHPDPAHLLVSGTGLTHLGSASARNQMHRKLESVGAGELTDSLKLFKLGTEEGKPADGGPGVQPEWFYKGNGHNLVAPGAALPVPDFSLDAGEEGEIVGLYVVAADGTPCRVGFALGNELSDHVTERQNYLYLAHSKLRPCSFGPELLLGELPEDVSGVVRVRRHGQVLWQKAFASGERNMSHRLRGLEHHHFKYQLFRVPGDVHVHFFGADVLSFSDGVRAHTGDRFEIECASFGRPLVNELATRPAPATSVHQL